MPDAAPVIITTLDVLAILISLDPDNIITLPIDKEIGTDHLKPFLRLIAFEFSQAS
jgi:hypothetical protein